jgi:hypothetical protein
MPNVTPITPPRVPIIDPRTGYIDRAWYLFFLSLNNAAIQVYDNPDVGPSPESLIASYDAEFQSLTQSVYSQPSPVDLSSDLAELKQEVETAPRLEIGTIASQNYDNVNITGGKIYGLTQPLPTNSGGTGQTTFIDGQLLIGNATGNTLSKSTLTAGSNISITNGPGSIIISSSFSTTGATGSVTLAKITAPGSNGSLTFSNGLITAFTAPT